MSVAVYSSDGNTQITETGAQATVNAAVNSKTGLAAFTLAAGTPYWTCWCATSATYNYLGPTVGVTANDPMAVANAFVTNIGRLTSGCTGGDTPNTISPAGLTADFSWRPMFVMFSKE